MKLPLSWLKQYVDFPWSAAELAERLTFAGVEVEEVADVGGGALAQVVVCQVLASDQHPNADRLTVCQVTDGQTERQIVCGAKNYQVGDKVPLALPGITLPNGLTIKTAKLRGVESHGMLCSAQELGLSEDAEGLLILPADTAVGATVSDALGGTDTVLDITITPNRPDWLSVIGIAREVAALAETTLRLPEPTVTEDGEPTATLCRVTLEAPDLCPRYTARVIRGVRIGPSPAWLRQVLDRVGLRSINNVVDVTNYVLLETGHPLHAFDYNLLQSSGSVAPIGSGSPRPDTGGGPASTRPIIVRRARNGELFQAIDDSQHELREDMLVIADAAHAVALAGIMGGKNSEINDGTTDVLLEAAYFHPPGIRRTSKQLGLASESSYRFERGTDIEGLLWASDRATALIQQLAGGRVSRGLVDALARPVVRRRVSCRYAQVNRVLGIEVPPATVRRIFTGLGLTIIGSATGAVEVEVPSFRVDLEREVDLIEEVCRIHGVDQIPSRMQPVAAVAVSAFDARWDAHALVRDILTALGYHEALNQTLGVNGAVKLQNPLSVDQGVLRAALVPGLLGNLRTNVSRHQHDLRLFEIGHVFAADGRETLHLALVVTGRRDPHSWEAGAREALLDFHDVKGALEELADQLAVVGLDIGAADPAVAGAATVAPPPDAPQAAGVRVGDQRAGAIWQVPPATARALDLRTPVCVAELELEPLLAARSADRQYTELPKFPAVVRDMALVVDEGVPHGDIVAAIAQQRTNILERVELFDIFQGGTIPTGRKSLAYSLTFRAPDRTLTDAEVNTAHQELKRRVQQVVPCAIRES
ncbi:phenylalanine--tRNA ligase subunit beta [bacterium]|nr:phenylalanine--tRNA ligase subunit beta [bacterium]